MLAVWTAALLALAGTAVITASGDARPEVDFRQSGHRVYNADERAVFHVDGGAKHVDARTGEVIWTGDRTVVQGDRNVFGAGQDDIVVFGKSTLAVDGTHPAAGNEILVVLEVVGGPYFVYRKTGPIVRFDHVPPTVIELGGRSLIRR